MNEIKDDDLAEREAFDPDYRELTEAEIDAILSEYPESDAYADSELEQMAQEYITRYGA